MTTRIILASGSETRRRMLENAGVAAEVRPVRIDESSIRDAMTAEGAKPRDIADRLAEFKAQKVSAKDPDAIVIGCDQVLEFENRILGKPASAVEVRDQLGQLNGRRHRLFSAAVICQQGRPVWRNIGEVRLHMRQSTADYLDDYVARNWDGIQHSVGGYKLEEEGVRLFHRIEGDYFNVLGLPLLELLAYLTLRGYLPG